MSYETNWVDEGGDVGIDLPVIVEEERRLGVSEHREAEHEEGSDDEQRVTGDLETTSKENHYFDN